VLWKKQKDRSDMKGPHIGIGQRPIPDAGTVNMKPHRRSRLAPIARSVRIGT